MKSRRLRSRRGFTVVEALVTLGVFSVFLAILFLTIAWGFRSFSLAMARSDVTTEARRLTLYLERELRSSNYFSITTAKQPTSADRRDGICFVSRDDWSSPGAFDALEGRPAWNRYFVYYATDKQPTGEFVRLVLDPASVKPEPPNDPIVAGPYPYGPFAGDPTLYMLRNPLTYVGPDLEHLRVLASSVKSFEVKKLPTTQEIQMRFLLRQNGVMARRGNGDREGGTFELQYRVKPQNTL